MPHFDLFRKFTYDIRRNSTNLLYTYVIVAILLYTYVIVSTKSVFLIYPPRQSLPDILQRLSDHSNVTNLLFEGSCSGFVLGLVSCLVG